MTQISPESKFSNSNYKENSSVNDSSNFNYLNINFTGVIPSGSDTHNIAVNTESSNKEANEENTKM